ncbi:MAG: hypothetical protein WD334_06615, partial [Chitinophagales bacterium]
MYFSFLLISIVVFFQAENLFAQDEKADQMKAIDYYSELPAAPEKYTPENVAARMIDALGFRYYWATEGLRKEDLDYRPTPEARSTSETLEHIYELVLVVKNTAEKTPTDRAVESPEMTFDEMRNRTLQNLKLASDLLKASQAGSLEDFPVQFKKGEEVTEKPFWNLINGMLTDAIGHTGQIVSFRRTSGNPVLKKISYFSGVVR